MKNKCVGSILIVMTLAIAMAVSGCSASGTAVDPGEWGYDCLVTYDALGGIINAREVRKTYYLPNSYLFMPSGSSNMLIKPARDGYLLAGWYTAKADHTEGSMEEYTFNGADRWDFNTDRVQDDVTLYARWLPRAKVDYINADTGEVLFSKNITSESPIQALSDSVMKLSAPAGSTFAGYYMDAACTQVYDFSASGHVDPNPTEEQLYAQLSEMFPQYIGKKEYVAPEKDAAETVADTSWLFLNQLGYELLTDDAAAIAEIDTAKDELVETAISEYFTSTSQNVVYMKFTEGSFVRVRSVKDLKRGATYGFYDTDSDGNPIDGYSFEADIDCKGVSFTLGEGFAGTINGNGYTLSNLSVMLTSAKRDTDKEKTAGLFTVMENAKINDLTIQDAVLRIQVNSGIKVTGGLLAGSAKDVVFTNCVFDGLTIDSGKGDDGKARYTLGDLFGSSEGCTFEQCTADGLEVTVRTPEKLQLSLFTQPEPPADVPAEGDAAVPAP